MSVADLLASAGVAVVDVVRGVKRPDLFSVASLCQRSLFNKYSSMITIISYESLIIITSQSG
jgi:hypothetical protein